MAATEPHRESAKSRTVREFGRVLESWRFIALTVLFDAGCAVVGAFVARAFSTSVSWVLVAALIGTVGGTALSLALVGTFQLVRAPYRQRDEARSELAALKEPNPFPRLAIDIDAPKQYDHRNGNLIIDVSMLITNREPSNAVSLEFRLDFYAEDGKTVIATAFPEGAELISPLRIGPNGENERLSLRFVLAPSVVNVVRDPNKYRAVPAQFLGMLVNERVTGRYITLRVPSYYPPVYERGPRA